MGFSISALRIPICDCSITVVSLARGTLVLALACVTHVRIDWFLQPNTLKIVKAYCPVLLLLLYAYNVPTTVLCGSVQVSRYTEGIWT